MLDGTQWYFDPEVLLLEVQKTGMHWGQLPDIPGYDQMVEIRRGGQGIVYRARQRSTNRTVAIKLLLDGMFASDESRLRFQREIESAARLRHPNIVPIYDSGLTAEGGLYYVMEFVDGAPVDGAGMQHGHDLDGTLILFTKICDAVQHAHRHGVIHRDLKPGNILIDEAGEPRILDFGLAKLVLEEMTGDKDISTVSRTGRFLGSLAWASPEQIDDSPDRIDSRTDVYSLGVVLYQLVTGRLPHILSSNLRQTLNEITTADPPRPRVIRRDIPDDVETIVLRSLAKDPARRYPSVGDLGRDVRHFLAGEPIDAKRDRTWYVFRKTVARHKTATAFTLLLLVFIIGFAITMAVLYRRANDAERLARERLVEATTQTAKAEAVRDFLQDLIAKADPFVSADRTVTVREILDSAALQIPGRFGEHPEVEAEIHAVIGQAYYSLGHLDAAEEHDRAALALLREIHGQDHPDVAGRIRDLAVIETDRRHFEEAEALLKEARGIFETHLGAHHVRTADCLLNLAELRQVQFRFEESNTLYESTFRIYRDQLGLNNHRTLMTLIQWSSMLISVRELEKAEELLDLMLETIEKHPVENASLKCGVLLSLGLARFNGGDLDAAESILNEAIQSQQEVFGDEHPRLAEIYNVMGYVFRERRQFAEAEAWHRKALEVCEKLAGRESAEGAGSLWNIAQSLWLQGDLDEAETLFKEALAIRRKMYGEGHHMVQAAASRLGQLFSSVGRWDKALPYVEEAARLKSESLGDAHRLTARANAVLGECLAELGRHEESERLLLAAHNVLASSEEVYPEYKRHVLASLVKLYTAWEKPDAAEKYRALLSAQQTGNGK